MNDPMIVLDSSAYLAIANQEPGHERVADYIIKGNIWMSAMNIAEVITKQVDIGIQPEAAISMIRLLGIHIEPFDIDDVMMSSSLRKSTQALGLSLGDRACLGLARRLNCPTLTADRIWSELDLPIEVIQIR